MSIKNKAKIRAGLTISVVTIAAMLSLNCKFGSSDDAKDSKKGPAIAWGLKGIFDAPQVESIAFSMLAGATSGSHFGFLEFIKTPYGVIANVNLNSLEPGSYFVSITDRNVCTPGNHDFPAASVEAEVGVIKIGDQGFAKVSKLLTEYNRTNFEVFDLFGKCVEVRAVSGGPDGEGSILIALGEIGSKEKSDLVF